MNIFRVEWKWLCYFEGNWVVFSTIIVLIGYVIVEIAWVLGEKGRRSGTRVEKKWYG